MAFRYLLGRDQIATPIQASGRPTLRLPYSLHPYKMRHSFLRRHEWPLWHPLHVYARMQGSCRCVVAERLQCEPLKASTARCPLSLRTAFTSLAQVGTPLSLFLPIVPAFIRREVLSLFDTTIKAMYRMPARRVKLASNS